jgi:hypothetical protein
MADFKIEVECFKAKQILIKYITLGLILTLEFLIFFNFTSRSSNLQGPGIATEQEPVSFLVSFRKLGLP